MAEGIENWNVFHLRPSGMTVHQLNSLVNIPWCAGDKTFVVSPRIGHHKRNVGVSCATKLLWPHHTYRGQSCHVRVGVVDKNDLPCGESNAREDQIAHPDIPNFVLEQLVELFSVSLLPF